MGLWSEELMVCAARIEVGPLGQTFWAIVDRDSGEIHEHTRITPPGRRGQVWTEGSRIGAGDASAVTRIEAPGVRATLHCSGGAWVEAVCAAGGDAYTWTRKRSTPIECDLRIGDRALAVRGRGIEDESAGYHPRHTAWSWSAGAGHARGGREVAWSLVEGINDPPAHSERAIWLDGEPFEPAAVSFDGLEGIAFDDGARLEFAAEAERRRTDNLVLVRSSYRQPFGSFSGALPGGIELESGLGVMERHEATW